MGGGCAGGLPGRLRAATERKAPARLLSGPVPGSCPARARLVPGSCPARRRTEPEVLRAASGREQPQEDRHDAEAHKRRQGAQAQRHNELHAERRRTLLGSPVAFAAKPGRLGIKER